jgi:PAS domain S-box-containing protein
MSGNEMMLSKERDEPSRRPFAIAYQFVANLSARCVPENSNIATIRLFGNPPLWGSLGIGILAVVIAFLIRESFHAPLGTRLVYVTFYPWVAIATVTGGLAAGVLATALTIPLIFFWVAPPADIADWMGLASFLVGSALIVGISETMHRARTRAAKAEEAALLSEEIRKSEERYRTLIEQASDGIFVSDAQGRYLDVNSAGCRMLGYSREEILRENITDLIEADERPRLGPHLAKLRGGETEVAEWQFRRKDGSLLVGEVSARQLPDGRLQAFVRDASERKQAEQRQVELVEELTRSESEAREQHALFRSIFDGVPEGIALIDQERDIVMVNPALTRIFGYGANDLIGASTLKLYACPTEWKDQTVILRDVDRIRLQPRIIRFQRKSGEMFPGEVISAPYRNGRGELRGYIGIIRDVSEEQRREEELRQAQRLESLGQLTGGIAHDFNNLLTVITGNLQLIDMGLKDERLKRYLNQIEHAAQMGAQLNKRLTLFGRQQMLAPIAINLNDCVTNMLEILRRTIGEDITVRIALSNNLWSTRADPDEIENAILNLAINARDAMPNGGKLVFETENAVVDKDAAREELPPGRYVRLSVSDTGSGMPPEVLARAFEPFFTTKEPGKGTGLGLSSIYGFVKQSGGHITIDSEVGHGTTATLYFPKLDHSEKTDLAAPEQETETPIRGAGETILVVEDNPDVRRVTVERIKSLGYKVIEAKNGQGAIAAFDENEVVDLVFSDVIMPGGMSGFELADRIREFKPSQRVLLTSGFPGAATRAGERINHKFLMLRKPYNQIELGRFIQAALRDQDSPNQTRVTSAAST